MCLFIVEKNKKIFNNTHTQICIIMNNETYKINVLICMYFSTIFIIKFYIGIKLLLKQCR